MSSNLKYYLAFSHCLGIGPVRFDKLLNHYKSAENAYKAPDKEISNILGPIIGEKFVYFRKKFNYEKKIKELGELKIKIITKEDKQYPAQLRNISDPPICLYVKGELATLSSSLKKMFAIVGTRKPTSYGRQIAQNFSQVLAKAGLTIVSGMALGIDSIAHENALLCGGKTIAVLGCGVDIIYPPSNRNLYQNIISSGSCIVSEFPPGQLVARGLFIARNRIISGLSRGVLVAEGAIDSGALITARHAADQGRDVYAPPSPITSAYSHAPNRLLKDGANLVTSPEDILEQISISYTAVRKHKKYHNLSPLEKNIVKEIQKESTDADNLSILFKIPVAEILTAITNLELNGIIKKQSDGKFTPV